jgi:hypothetical protein
MSTSAVPPGTDRAIAISSASSKARRGREAGERVDRRLLLKGGDQPFLRAVRADQHHRHHGQDGAEEDEVGQCRCRRQEKEQ